MPILYTMIHLFHVLLYYAHLWSPDLFEDSRNVNQDPNESIQNTHQIEGTGCIHVIMKAVRTCILDDAINKSSTYINNDGGMDSWKDAFKYDKVDLF